MSVMAHATSTIKAASAINSLANMSPSHLIALQQRARNLRLFLGLILPAFFARSL
jgi:hypothetical protein